MKNTITKIEPAQIDPLHETSPPGVLWTRANTSEALPGVLTPLCWSFYGPLAETNVRRGLADLGIVPRFATRYPTDVADRLLGIFHGRYALNVGVLRNLMVGFPGVRGDDVERDILGAVREGVHDAGFGRRLHAVVWRAPARFLTTGRDSTRLCHGHRVWWGWRVGPGGPLIDPYRLLDEAVDRFGAAIRLQGRTRMLFQATTTQLTALAAEAGDQAMAMQLLSGEGNLEEAIVADDLYKVATGSLTLTEFLGLHGFHGSNGGDVAARSWREDPSPLVGLLPALADAGDPAIRRRRQTPGRDEAARWLIDALPRSRRPQARIVLRLAPAAAQALERTKSAFLMALDAARCATRAIGRELVANERLFASEGAFQLLLGELTAPPDGDLRSLVARRMAGQHAHRAIIVPETWVGQPEPVAERSVQEELDHLTGIGVSPGTVTGRVRVVLDPSDTDVGVGEIVVCPTTDPSWVSLMTVAAGLVIDVGGPASHGAIVARELGVPCVTGTRVGTGVLRDGMLVRLDGGSGSVQILDSSFDTPPDSGRGHRTGC